MRPIRTCVVLAAIVALAACATTATVRTVRVAEYEVEPPTQARQTKSSVTIEVEMITPSNAYRYPELFAFDYNLLPKSHQGISIRLAFPEDAQGRRWCYPFVLGDSALTVARVKVTNNTPHILRMKDSRIYLVAEGQSPVGAVTSVGNSRQVLVDKRPYPASYLESDGSLVHWLTQFEVEYAAKHPGLLRYPIGLAALVVRQNRAHYTLINDLAAEILPEFPAEGLMVFPERVAWDSARLMFYDIIVKTDPAGNTLEKVSFTFPVRKTEVSMWYDAADSMWKEGQPPAVAVAPKRRPQSQR